MLSLCCFREQKLKTQIVGKDAISNDIAPSWPGCFLLWLRVSPCVTCPLLLTLPSAACPISTCDLGTLASPTNICSLSEFFLVAMNSPHFSDGSDPRLRYPVFLNDVDIPVISHNQCKIIYCLTILKAFMRLLYIIALLMGVGAHVRCKVSWDGLNSRLCHSVYLTW